MTYRPEFFSGPFFTTAEVVFITAKIAFIFTSLFAFQINDFHTFTVVNSYWPLPGACFAFLLVLLKVVFAFVKGGMKRESQEFMIRSKFMGKSTKRTIHTRSS